MARKTYYDKLNDQFVVNIDSGLIQNRKSVILEGNLFGYSRRILVYKKAMLSEIKLGSKSIVYGWSVAETVKDPERRLDGFIICIEA